MSASLWKFFADADSYYLIYELADKTTLFDHIRSRSSFSEENGADFTRQVAMALALAHSQGVVHGRLSPNSLILAPEDEEDDEDAQTQVKLCDMGQSFFLRPSRLEDGKKENLSYIAPELAWNELKIEGTVPKGADKLDMWALGAVIYHMLTGMAPFEAPDEKGLLEKIKSEGVQYRDEEWSKVSAQARDLVEGLLKLNSSLRTSASQLLKHPWIKVARETMPKKKMISLLGNMEMNLNEGYFKRMVLRVIAEMLPKDGAQVETIEKAFRVLDKNGDGVLSVQELCDGFGKYPELKKNYDLQSLFKQLDRDGSGTINVQEFVTATVNQRRSNSLPNLWQAFNAFDKDQSGSIAIEEIENIVRELEGGLLGKEQMDDLCKEIRSELQTVEKGEQIDFDQFVYIMSVETSSKGDFKKAMSKDINRMAWKMCSIDNYNVRSTPVLGWSLAKSGASPRSPRSVYRRAQRGGEGDRRASRKSRIEAGAGSK